MNERIEAAKRSLPIEFQTRPWDYPGICHGVGILTNQEQLDAYILAYMEMHEIKLRAAFQNFPFQELMGTVEIVDWGCGQGIGSLYAIETLEERDLLQWLRKVTLIDASRKSVEAASREVETRTNGLVKVLPESYYLPGDGSNPEIKGLEYECANVIHIFSNILDIHAIDLEKLARICSVGGHKHFIVCMGPTNGVSYRINQFCDIFGDQKYFSDIENRNYGMTSNFKNVSCKTRCFVYNGNPLVFSNAQNFQQPDFVGRDYLIDDYDIMKYESSVMSRLYRILCQNFNPDEDVVLLNPTIGGDKIDLMVLSPGKGVLLVSLFYDDIRNYRLFENQPDDENTLANGRKYNQKRLVNIQTGEIILSPLQTICTLERSLVKEKTMDLLSLSLGEKKSMGIVRKMVLFTQNSSSDALKFFKDEYSVRSDYFFDEVILFGTDLFENKAMQNSLRRFTGMTSSKPGFTKELMSGLLRLIVPGWHSYKEGKHIRLTPAQERLAKSTGISQKISGAAGTGKTLVLANRVVNAQQRTGGNVLVLTYNKTLVNYLRMRINEVRADFPWDKIDITHYFSFFKQQANRNNKPITTQFEDNTFIDSPSYRNVGFFDSCWQLAKYDAVFIDEVQDFRTEWLQIVQKYFLKEKGEFVVFGDSSQNVFNRPLDANGDVKLGIIPGIWNHDLTRSKRYKSPAMTNLLKKFQIEFIDGNVEPIDTDVDSSNQEIPMHIEYKNFGVVQDIDAVMDYILRSLSGYSIKHSDVAVIAHENSFLMEVERVYNEKSGQMSSSSFSTEADLAKIVGEENRVRYHTYKDTKFVEDMKKNLFTTSSNLIKISTIDSFKGWESPTVVLIIQRDGRTYQDSPFDCKAIIPPEVIYAGLTRASESLFVINLGNDFYDGFFKRHIKN